MRDTAENRGAMQAVVRQIVGRFGGGFQLSAEYIIEMSRTLLEECSTEAVFHAVSRELLSMAPTDQNGNRRVPTPYDVVLLARANAEQKPECPRCGGSGWLSRDLQTANPCAAGMYTVPVADRCSCSTIYRLPADPSDAKMADIASLVEGTGGGR